MVKVLVGQRSGGKFAGFYAEFEGDAVSSYKDERGEKNIAYTLYRCTAYNWDAYRVHIADESNPDAPVYELLPFEGDLRSGGGRLNYSEAWTQDDIAEHYPLFLKDIDYFDSRNVDPKPGGLSGLR